MGDNEKRTHKRKSPIKLDDLLAPETVKGGEKDRRVLFGAPLPPKSSRNTGKQ